MRSKLFPVFAILALVAFAGDAPSQEILHGHVRARPRLFGWLLPSQTPGYIGTYVGGGSSMPHKAEPRRDDEGTWGLDYQGLFFRRRVVNGYWHGRHYQGGTGAYKSDGPKLYEEK